MMKRVLFLCTGNSCRSQMAEAMVNAHLGDHWQAYSAGTKPAGYVHPIAIQVLHEAGINHDGRSKLVEEYRNEDFDLVISVCDSAAEECPVWLGPGKRAHISFPDPASVVGSESQILEAFRQVRDDIAKQIPKYLQGFSK